MENKTTTLKSSDVKEKETSMLSTTPRCCYENQSKTYRFRVNSVKQKLSPCSAAGSISNHDMAEGKHN
jgi:hypothetical protein